MGRIGKVKRPEVVHKKRRRACRKRSTCDGQPLTLCPVTLHAKDDENDGDDEDECTDEEGDLALMTLEGVEEEKKDDVKFSYTELRKVNRQTLKKRTNAKMDIIAKTPVQELIYFSRYAKGLIPKLQESLVTLSLKRKPPSSDNRDAVLAYLNASFDLGAGAVGFIHYTWKEIADSGVELVNSEVQRVLIAKIIMNVVSPDRCVKDDINPTLVSVDLYSREATFELRGLGDVHVQIEVGDIDCCLLACASPQAREFVMPQVEMYVNTVMPSAIADGNFSHSSLEVLGNIN